MTSVAALALIIGLGLSSCSPAGEKKATEENATEQGATEQVATESVVNDQDASVQNAKARLKAMSDYLAAQKAISLSYDTVFEVVSKDHQKLQIATSGTMLLNRPDKIRASRKTGFSDTETVFDGKTLTILGKIQNSYVQAEVPGTIDTLIDQLRDRFPPAASWCRSAPSKCLRRAHDRRDGC
jgi:hypothetical protein